MARTPIDRDRLRALVRTFDEEDLLRLLERAIDLLPATKLPALIRGYAKPSELAVSRKAPRDLLATVQKFYDDSLKGQFREDFNVNSKNFMKKSRGTMNWIAECERLMGLAIEASGTADPLKTRTTFELLFAMLAELDTGNDRIVFFADEGGSWQVGVAWARVIPAWCKVMAATAEPEEYAASARSVIASFAHWQAEPLLAAALDQATPAQRAALSALPPPERGPERPLLATLS